MARAIKRRLLDGTAIYAPPPLTLRRAVDRKENGLRGPAIAHGGSKEEKTFKHRTKNNMRNGTKYVHGPRMAAATAVLLCILLAGAARAQSHAPAPTADTLRLSLEEAVGLAMEHNLGLKASRYGEESARYSELQQWSNIMPSISAKASYNRQVKKPVMFFPEDSPMAKMGNGTMEIGSDNSYTGSITATLPLLAMPAYRGIQGSKVDKKIAQEQVRNAKVNLAGQVRLAYISILLAEKSLAVMDSSMATAERTLRNVENLTRQGLTAEYDLVRARVQVSNLRPLHVQAVQGLETAQLSFRTLLGMGDTVALALTGTLETLVAACDEAALLEENTLQNNSDLRLMALQSEKLHRQYQMARETLWPTLAAFANYQIASQANSFDFSKYKWVNSLVIGVQLDIPLFSGLRKHWQIQQVKIGQRQLEAQTSYTRDMMQTQVVTARQQMLAARESMLASQEGEVMARQGVSIAQTRFSAGAGTLLELNDAEMALTQASLNYHQAQYNFARAYVQYMQLRGDL